MTDRLQALAGLSRTLVRAFGWRGGFRRLSYVARLRSGWFRRRLPCTSNFQPHPPVQWTHRFDLPAIRTAYERTGLAERIRVDVVSEADQLLYGELRMFGGLPQHVGWPPRWNSIVDSSPQSTHWSLLSDDLFERDIKDTWEPSRLRFTFLLVRAFALTDDDRYVAAWWDAVESWAAENPPNTGLNWRCGQESSLRGIAICFGLSAFSEHAETNPARRDLAARIIGATITRVRPTVGYALSQRNNHAISELVFLLATEPRLSRRRVRQLIGALRDQWYADGSYAQQSFVYQRLAIHALVWLLHVQPKLPKRAFEAITRRLEASESFLERCLDPVSGALPNYGANDGSMLLDLARADHLDGRPLLALLGVPCEAEATEPTVWFPPDDIGLTVGQAPRDLDTSTYVTLRGQRSLLLTRVGDGRHRSGDDDQQAFELFIDGVRIVLDPGTYRYSGSSPWRQPFTSSAAHSMARPSTNPPRLSVGRFLREPMPIAEVTAHSVDGDTEILVTRRLEGQLRLTRAFLRFNDRYAIVDTCDGGMAISHWLLSEGEVVDGGGILIHGATVSTLGSSQVTRRWRDEADPTSGWWSPTYGRIEPVVALDGELLDGGVLVARFSPAEESPVSINEIAAALIRQPDLQQRVSLLKSSVETAA